MCSGTNRDIWIANEILKQQVKGFYQLSMYPLDNFSAFQITYNGQIYPTSEHLYQALKFQITRPDISEEIRLSRSPHEAKELAHLEKNAKYVRTDWDTVKVELMKTICIHKTQQHPYVRKKLLDSGNYPLAELSMSDSFWGIGPDGNGQNMLGHIWEEIREALRRDEAL